VKKFAVAALSLAVISTMSVAHAAPVIVDAATYTLTFDDSFLGGTPTVNVSGDAVDFSGATAVAMSPLLGSPSYAQYGIDSYNGRPFPIIVTAKAGYKITGLSESISGEYAAGVDTSSIGDTAMAGAGFQSFWVANGTVQSNSASQILADLQVIPGRDGVADVTSPYTLTGSLILDAAATNVKLSAIGTGVFAMANGSSFAYAQTSLSNYTVNVQTTAVPEPEVYGLMLAGLAVVGVSLSRRRTAR